MYDITPKHKFLVGIDSDGCAFDTMELKHKECFIPATILHYGLQGISKYAREAAEFVNLYSRSRGINRFPAPGRNNRVAPEAARGEGPRHGDSRFPPGWSAWMKRETKLANPALEAEVKKSGDPDLTRALAWSKAVNETIGRMVSGVPPSLSSASRWRVWPPRPISWSSRRRPTKLCTANGKSTASISTSWRFVGKRSARRRKCSSMPANIRPITP